MLRLSTIIVDPKGLKGGFNFSCDGTPICEKKSFVIKSNKCTTEFEICAIASIRSFEATIFCCHWKTKIFALREKIKI